MGLHIKYQAQGKYMEPVSFTPIGKILSPWKSLENMPIQPTGAQDVLGEVHVLDEFTEGLKDLDGFSHVHLFYFFHRNTGFELTLKPFMDTTPRGLFSTRAPRRPNMLGMSTVRLESVEGNILHIRGVDILDGTPLLDIKPYVAEFDNKPDARFGWLDENAAKAETLRSDTRFVKK